MVRRGGPAPAPGLPAGDDEPVVLSPGAVPLEMGRRFPLQLLEPINQPRGPGGTQLRAGRRDAPYISAPAV